MVNPQLPLLLSRFVEGEALTSQEANVLKEALASAEARTVIRDGILFESLLRSLLFRPEPSRIAAGRHRLLERAGMAYTERASPQAGDCLFLRVTSRRVRLFLSGLVTGLVVFLLYFAIALPYPDITMRGDIHRAEGTGEGGIRGATLFSGREEATLDLGGYVDLTLAPGTQVTVLGEPWHESVSLEEGQVDVRMNDQGGLFTLLTGRSVLRTSGASFTVRLSGGGRTPRILRVQVSGGLLNWIGPDGVFTVESGQSREVEISQGGGHSIQPSP